MIERIVLDLDDTLNSCSMYILQFLGCDVGPFDYHKFPTEVGYNLVDAWAKLNNREPVPGPVFWEWISRKAWEQMPMSHEFWLLDAAAEMVGAENVIVGTSPTKSADCLFGKYQWIINNLPKQFHRQYAVTPRKHWMAQPGVLLIDDCDENVRKWRKYGGKAIIVPRPWNSLHYLSGNTGVFLRSALKDLQ